MSPYIYIIETNKKPKIMKFNSGNPYRNLAIQKAKRLKEEREAMEKWDNLTTEEQELKEKENGFNNLTSQRADTHSMQSSFYGRKS